MANTKISALTGFRFAIESAKTSCSTSRERKTLRPIFGGIFFFIHDGFKSFITRSRRQSNAAPDEAKAIWENLNYEEASPTGLD